MTKKLEKMFDEEFEQCRCSHQPCDLVKNVHGSDIKAFIDKHFIAKEDADSVLSELGKDVLEYVEKKKCLELIGEDRKCCAGHWDVDCDCEGYNKAKAEIRKKLI